MMQKDVMRSFIALENKMARLKQNTLKLSREEYLKNQSEEDESLEITMEKVTCPKCSGDKNESTATHIQDLCPADRKKITQLISELARCTQEKHKVTADLVVSKAETEALQNQLQLLNSQHEDDMNKLRSQLSYTRAEMSKLRLRMSHSVKLLTEQILALENQSSRLIETVKDLLNDKTSLQDAVIRQRMKVQILEGKVKEMKNSKDIEKLLFVNEKTINQTRQKNDKYCQTKAEDNLQKICPSSRLEISKANNQIKSKRDLDESSSEAILLRDLFFKRPSIDENEGLDFFSKLPRS